MVEIAMYKSFKTHKRLKERFLIRRNRTKRAIFDVIIFFKLRTIQQKTVKPTYLCPLGARKLAEGKAHFFRTLAVNSVSDFSRVSMKNG